MRPALCIVVPVLDEAPTLSARLEALQGFRQRGARVVVVDGGSQDNTLAIAQAHADLALLAPRGRASQMNAGAAACPADVLLFLHADTQLPDNADVLVRRATLGPFAWGRFDVRIDSPPRSLLRLVATMMNVRSRWTGITTGDQALFLMWRLRAAYFLGVDPRQLAIQYGYTHADLSAILHQVQVAVLARAPVPGLAKTRLIPALGPQGAARLQRLTRAAVQTALDAGLGAVTLWCEPHAQHRFFRALHKTTGIQCFV